MSDEQATSPGAAPSAGALLRAAREHAGLPLEEFAASLKVAARKVELIETDQFDQLPDAVFARALAQSMCRALKIDPAQVLALLPRAPDQRLDRIHVGLNTSYREGPSQGLPDDWVGRALPFMGGAALLLAGAMLFYFLPSSWQTPAKVSPRTAAVPPVADSAASEPSAAAPLAADAAQRPDSAAPSRAPVPAETQSTGTTPSEAGRREQPLAVSTNVAPASPMPPPTPATPQATPPAKRTAIVAPAPVAPAAPATTTPARVESAPPAPAAAVAKISPAPAAGGLLQFRASEVAWVEVQDAQGSLLLARELRAGEAVVINGTTPLKVVVGNVKATQVAFRGKAMDLRSFTRDNVARVELQ